MKIKSLGCVSKYEYIWKVNHNNIKMLLIIKRDSYKLNKPNN